MEANKKTALGLAVGDFAVNPKIRVSPLFAVFDDYDADGNSTNVVDAISNSTYSTYDTINDSGFGFDAREAVFVFAWRLRRDREVAVSRAGRGGNFDP